MIPISIQAQSKIKSTNTLEDKIYGLSLLWSEVKYIVKKKWFANYTNEI